jgi:hypothetical protein
VDPQVTAATDTAAHLFAETLGAQVEEATPDIPPSRGVPHALERAMGTVTADLLLPRVGRERIDPSISTCGTGGTADGGGLHRALVLRGEHFIGR